MLNDYLRISLVVLGALILSACGSSQQAGSSTSNQAKPVLMKMPIAYSTSLPGFGEAINGFVERVNTISDGRLTIKLYEPNKLVAPLEILDAVSTGKVDAGYSTAGYWAGKLKASPIFSSIPFGPEAGEYLAWLWYDNGMRYYQQMYDNGGYDVKVMVCGLIAPETSGWFAKSIDKPSDLQGLRMRFFGLGGEVMQKLGVSTSLLPGGEIFAALEKGAIDATEFSMPAIDQRLGFYKVVKYNYFPGWHQQATILEVLVNKQRWESLSKGQQLLLETSCKASTVDLFAHTEAIQGKAMRTNVEQHGVKERYWSPEMLKLFADTWEEVAQNLAAEDPFFKEVWDDLQAFRVDYDHWQRYAFLPRETP